MSNDPSLNPYESPAEIFTEVVPLSGKMFSPSTQQHLRNVAYAHWALMTCIAAKLTAVALWTLSIAEVAPTQWFDPLALKTIYIAFSIAAFACALVLVAWIDGIAWAVTYAVLLLIPCVGFLALFVAAGKATQEYEDHGLEPGFFGFSPWQFEIVQPKPSDQ